jgi:hypothetical protein
MGGDDDARRAPSPQRVRAGRDAWIAGRDLSVTNNFLAGGNPGAEDFYRARVHQAAEDLAVAVGDQWRLEERLRRVQDPAPLPVRWRAADPLLTDHLVNVRRGPGDDLGLDGALGDVVEVFTRIPSRRLVVTGQPGAGKTVFTLRLTLGLLDRRCPGEPVPVIFGMHAWNPREQTLQEWMADRLATDYPALRSKGTFGSTVARDLVGHRLILPVLDGLDEISHPLRGHAMRMLNMSLDGDMAVIVTCRDADYRQVVADADVLTSAAVIELLPLELSDLAVYLPRTTRKVRVPPGFGTKWDPVLEQLRNDPAASASRVVLEVLSAPLMTSLARSVYSDTDADPGDLVDGRFANRREMEAYLLDAFIPAAFAGPALPGAGRLRRTWRADDAERWLAFLARHLRRLGTCDLEWWRLEDAIPPPARWLSSGLVAFAVVVAMGVNLRAGLAWTCLVGTCGAVGLASGLALITAKLPPPAQGQPMGRRRLMVRRLGLAAVSAAPAGFILGFLWGQELSVIFSGGVRGLVSVLVSSLLMGIAYGATLGAAGFDGRQAPTTTPLQLRRKVRALSRRLLLGLGYGLLNGVLVSLVLWAIWAIGYTGAAEWGVQTTPVFLPGGTGLHYLPDGTRYMDYPDGLAFTIASNGDRYFMSHETGSFDGYLHGKAISGHYSRRDTPAPSSHYHYLGARVIRYDSSAGRIYITPLDVGMTGFCGCDGLDPGAIDVWLEQPGLLSVLAVAAYKSLPIALFAGLAASIIGSLFLWLVFPADVTRAIGPSSTMKTDRNAAMFRGGVIAILAVAVLTFSSFLLARMPVIVAGPISSVKERIFEPFPFEARFLVLALWPLAAGPLAFTLSTWARFQVAKAWLAAQGKVPWGLMRFLGDAHARGVLRQAGATYQFRHVRLQQQLSSAAKRPD